MAAFTVVGSTTLATAASTDPETFTIAVHGDAVVGDWVALALYGEAGPISVDARLTPIEGVEPHPYLAGGYGRLTELSDVEFTTGGTYPGLAVLTVLRPTGRGLRVTSVDYDFTYPAPTDTVTSSTPGASMATDALVWIGDASSASSTIDASDTDWTALSSSYATAPYAPTYQGLQVFEWHGSAPAPTLSSVPYSATTVRGRVFMTFTAAGRSALRQRQSPVRTPSRVRPPDLRARQTPYI